MSVYRARTGGAESRRAQLIARAVATSALTVFAGLATTAQAQIVPTGAVPVSGGVSVGAPTANAGGGLDLTVTQTGARGVVEWSSFSVGALDRVVFVQPKASSATLNRVTGDTASTIAGQISATGAVYLINPNGIAITTSGTVQTGGGFVASALDIADDDFKAGTLNFTGGGASNAVSNAGSITASAGGYVALLGGSVSNTGTISVPLGKVALGSGESIAIDLNGDGFLRVAAPTDAITDGDAALIEMTGSIAAAGGRVELRAAAVKDAVRNVINMTGGISADSATGTGGTIILFGEGGGAVTGSGTLSARATGTSGDGGFVETSGATVNFAGLKVDTRAANGAAGTWLIDPADIVVDAAGAATISGNLANGNVTLATGSDTAVAGNGDITVNSAIQWTSANMLTLQAYRNIALNAAITGTAGGLTLTAGNNVAYAGAVSATGAVNVGIFNLTNGNWSQAGTLPAFAARDFRLDVTRASFLRATGGAGTPGSPYTIADVYGLQGMASGTLLAKSFTLANAIDASGSANWNGGAGFVAIGTNGNGSLWNGSGFTGTGPTGFTGGFSGGGFTISNLTINRTSSYQGLFGYASGGGTIDNITLVGGSIKGGGAVGGLAGYTNAAVTRSSASGAVTGVGSVGGLVGSNGSNGSITGSSASGAVTGGGNNFGGLVGYGSGPISTSFATGSVTGGTYVGGLVGFIGDAAATIDQTYATGAVVSTTTGTGYAGGLVGFYNFGSTLARSYATGSVTANSTTAVIGGLVGYSAATITQSYATGRIGTTGQYRGGLVGQVVVGSVASSNFWDSYSTGVTTAVGIGTAGGTPVAVTSDPAQAQAANYAYKTSAYTGTGGLTAADWVFFDGQTRPFGAWEAVASGGTITNSHQLQLIGRANGAALSGTYTVGRAIDLSETGRVVVGTPASYAGMWAGTGFVAIGTDGKGTVIGGTGFTGRFSGGGFTIGNLTIKRTSDYQGLFGWVSGSSALSNLGLTGASVAGGQNTGGLVGYATGAGVTIAGVSVAGVVSGSSYVGGLAGRLNAAQLSKSNSSVAASGTSYVGGLVGIQASSSNIAESYATGNVTGSDYVGGLVGWTNAFITGTFATGTVTATNTLNSFVGGLIGYSLGATYLTNSYATGAVIGSGLYAGGLIGFLGGTSDPSGTSAVVASVYATGAVTGTDRVGGLIGSSTTYTSVSNAYASGAVRSTTPQSSNSIGGLVGATSGRVVASHWDSYSTGQSLAGLNSSTVSAVTSDPTKSAAANYAYKASAYTNLSPAYGMGTVDLGGFVFMPGNTTRPFLAAEMPIAGNPLVSANASGQLILLNSHQLQLVGYNGATLAGRYALSGNIDLAETGRVVVGTPGSYSGMWAGTGFVSLGSDGAGNLWNGANFVAVGYADVGKAGIATGFSGSLNGGGFTLSNLSVNRAGVQNVGLFGGSSGAISNLSVTGNVTGYISVGGLVGLQQGGSITGVTSAVNVTGSTGSAYVGGLVGFASGTTIGSSSASGTVSGTGATGGLVGLLYNSVLTNSSASAVVNGRAGRTGGLVGIVERSTVTGGSSSGTVNGTAGGTSYGSLRDGGTYNGIGEVSPN